MPQTLDPQRAAAIAANVAKMRAAHASDDDVEHYLRDIEGLTAAGAAPAPTSHNGVPFVDAKPEGQPGAGTKALGVLAAVNRDIPGAEAAQAGVRAIVREQGGRDFVRGATMGSGSLTDRLASGIGSLVSSPSYRAARNDIRGAEDAAPATLRTVARVTGGGLAALALPGGAVRQGATYGGLSGALESNPDAGVKDRAVDAGIGAGVGAVSGKLADAAAPIVRAKLGPIVSAAGGRVLDAVKRLAPTREAAPTMESLLAKMRAAQPNEIGATYGDAEEAMGLAPHQQPDLEEQLRQSIEAKGGIPVVPRKNLGEPDPAIFEQGRANLRRANAGDERQGLLADLGKGTIGPSSKNPLTGFGMIPNTARALLAGNRAVPRLSELDALIADEPRALQSVGTDRQSVLRALGITALTPTRP